MKLIRGTGIAVKALFTHRLRTALATLGIVIGVGSVIVMVSLGNGAEQEVLNKIQAMGTDLVMVTAGQVKIVAGRQRQMGNVSTLTMRDVKGLMDEARSLRHIAPAQGRKMLIKYDTVSASTTVTGTTEAILAVKI